MTSSTAALQVVSHEGLGDLHGVERSALAQVVGHHPDRQAMLHRRVAADTADVDGVLAGALGRCHVAIRSEEHTSELQSLMRISYAVFCLKKKKTKINKTQ